MFLSSHHNQLLLRSIGILALPGPHVFPGTYIRLESLVDSGIEFHHPSLTASWTQSFVRSILSARPGVSCDFSWSHALEVAPLPVSSLDQSWLKVVFLSLCLPLGALLTARKAGACYSSILCAQSGTFVLCGVSCTSSFNFYWQGKLQSQLLLTGYWYDTSEVSQRSL